MGLKASKFTKSRSNAAGGSSGRVRATKGYVPVCVGEGDDSKHYMIRASSFNDTDLIEYLEEAAREYGFGNSGVLRIPCDAKSFEEKVVARDGHRSLRIAMIS